MTHALDFIEVEHIVQISIGHRVDGFKHCDEFRVVHLRSTGDQEGL